MFFAFVIDLTDEFEAEMTCIGDIFLAVQRQLDNFSELSLILHIAALVALQEVAYRRCRAFLGACRHTQNAVALNEEIGVRRRAPQPRIVAALGERVEALLSQLSQAYSRVDRNFLRLV